MDVEKTKELLLRRRDEISSLRESRGEAWQRLQEPEVELEEEAAKEQMSRTMEQLEERERNEVEQIDAALRKLETSGYGICQYCGEPIREARLEAIPWTPYCIDCAREMQQGFPAPGRVETAARNPDRYNSGRPGFQEYRRSG